ncbi:MAG TPA: response regulator [Rhizomicrobium sp.]|nr:response regulator [Rhizomicrobium sp.]
MSDSALIVVIDDHESVRKSLRALLESNGLRVEDYESAIAYLADNPGGGDCVLVDLRMPHMTGLELQRELNKRNSTVPLIVISGHGDVPLAVTAMRAGAFDFLEKPFDDDVLLNSIHRALAEGRKARQSLDERKVAAALIGALTSREHEVLDLLVLGKSNKLIAHELGISPRTVETHRARLQEKLKARGLSDLVRLARALDHLH